jgi:hypothetical protein
MLSLCICKPDIRSTAKVGDFIFAFGSNNEVPPIRLIYIAEITRKLTNGEYYELDEYADRSDSIYALRPNGLFAIRAGAKHHGSDEQMSRDIGEPPHYKRANCLVSANFRYFGKNGTDDWKSDAPTLRRVVESLNQGHRVNHSRTVRDELLHLQQWAFTKYERKVLGKPLHAHITESCDDDERPKKSDCGRRRRSVKPNC